MSLQGLNAGRQRIANTLFLDFVGYSRLPMPSQAIVQQTLVALVHATSPMRALRPQDDIFLRKTGDGLMLVFFDDIEAPFVVARELDAAIKRTGARLREQIGSPFRLRMGIHRGPVMLLSENDELDIAGAGVNLAQRAMDAGDAGHILATDGAVDALGVGSPWAQTLHDLGNCRVKHDELIHLYNVHGTHDDGLLLGNEAVPTRVKESQEAALRLLDRDAIRDQQDRTNFFKGLAGRALLLLLIPLALLIIVSARHMIADYGDFAQKTKQLAAQKQAEKDAKRNPAPPDPTVPGELSATPGAGQIAPNTMPSPAPETPGGAPTLIGLDSVSATRAAESAGYRVSVNEQRAAQSDPKIPAGAVSAQVPAPGQPVGADATIYLTLSLGPDPNTPTSSGPTGVVVDARGVMGFSPGNDLVLCGPDGAPLYGNLGLATDESAALPIVGNTPLRISAVGMNTERGVLVSAEAVEQLRALAQTTRARTVVLHR